MIRPRAVLLAPQGFTLVELAVAALVLGIITAAAVPVYMGYVNDARFVAAQQMASAVQRALETCVQAKGPGSTCTRPEVLARVGATPAGATPGGRWIIETATLTLGNLPAVPMTGNIRLVGVAGSDTENLFVVLSPPSAAIVTGSVVRTPGGGIIAEESTAARASRGSTLGSSPAKPDASGVASTTSSTGTADGTTATAASSKATSKTGTATTKETSKTTKKSR